MSDAQTPESGAGSLELAQASEIRTFLIADIVGYTRFTEMHGDEAAARLTVHFAELTEAVVEAWRGRVVELRGDEALAEFGSGRDALHAAVALQSRLLEQHADDLPLEVRVGLDAGDAVPVRGGYRSGALNRAARLQAIADPGEVLASEVVVGLAGKTPGLVYLDRGEVQLKGLSDPVRVIRVVAEDKVPNHVPRFTVRPAPPTNLSPQPTRFVGREREVQEVAALVCSPDVRLLTLTGPGGIGKTRLAVRVSEERRDAFEDGVFFVSLASARDIDAVFHGIAQALNLPDVAGQSRMTTVRAHLSTREMLLVLDNLEQVIDVAPHVADLVSHCPRLTLVVTSRVVLHVYGEHEYPVPPMRVPDVDCSMVPEDLTRWESVSLFLDRVSLTQPGFVLTAENAAAVAEICRRLDGLPLAIELAAARIKLFPPRVLLSRLDNRLKLLTGGPRNLPARQQTLRNAIAWSYDLLDPSEQELFSRLSVFVGGCTLEAAEAVCNADGDLEIEVIDGLTSLCDKSLLQQSEGPGPGGYPESRFFMLETIREFAAERMAERGAVDDQHHNHAERDGADGSHHNQAARGAVDTPHLYRAGTEDVGERLQQHTARGHVDRLHRHHAEYYLSLADRSYEALMSAERDPWRAMWNIEWGNLRAMLHWSIGARQPDVGLPMAGLLWVWCWLDGPLEMRDWVERLLAMPEAQEPNCARGWGLGGAATLAYNVGDLGRVSELGAEAVTIARAHGDKRLLAGSLILACIAHESAVEMLEEARNLYRELGNDFGYGFVAVAAVRVLLPIGRLAPLGEWLTEALALFRRTGDIFGQALVLRAAGMVALATHKPTDAREFLTEALDRFRSMHEKRYFPLVLLTLGGISRLLGEPERAADEFREALQFVRRYTIHTNVASCIEGLAGVALDTGQSEQAAVLLGAARRMRDSSSSVSFPLSDVLNPSIDGVLQGLVDPETFATFTGRGAGMTDDEAVDLALAVSPPTARRLYG